MANVPGRSTSSLVALALCALLPGCSLLFEQTPGNETIDGGGQQDAGVVDARSNPLIICGPKLSDTTALFRVDDHDSDSLPDLLGGPAAESIAVVRDLDAGIDVLAATPLATVIEGPCGEAVSLTDRGNPFVRLAATIGNAPSSIDFWFRTTDVINVSGRRALLTKDRSGNGNGDMGIFVAKSVPTGTNHVLLRLQDGLSNSFFLCSGQIEVEQWHHVAVSFDAMQGAALFVDGVIADAVPDITPAFDEPAFCGFPTGAETATLDGNNRDWLWGASNSGAPNTNIADDVTPGAVDELRFRSVPFGPGEALSVYNRMGP